MKKYTTLRAIVRNDVQVLPKNCIELEDNSETKRLLKLKAIREASEVEIKKLDFIDLHGKEEIIEKDDSNGDSGIKGYSLEELKALSEEELDAIADKFEIKLTSRVQHTKVDELFEKLGE